MEKRDEACHLGSPSRPYASQKLTSLDPTTALGQDLVLSLLCAQAVSFLALLPPALLSSRSPPALGSSRNTALIRHHLPFCPLRRKTPCWPCSHLFSFSMSILCTEHLEPLKFPKCLELSPVPLCFAHTLSSAWKSFLRVTFMQTLHGYMLCAWHC